MKIIGINAPAGAGKDTLAGMLTSTHDVWIGGDWLDVRARVRIEEGTGRAPPPLTDGVTLAYADPMKVALRDWYGFSWSSLWGSSAKRNAPQPNANDVSVRTLLQTLGTEWARNHTPAIWTEVHDRTVERWIGDWCEPSVIVVPDVRYPNEGARIRDLGGLVIKLSRREVGAMEPTAAAHSSERAAHGDPEFDQYVTHHYANDGELSDLRNFARTLG